MKMMNKKAVALFSGGLDSTLAICMVKEQGIEIEAINFQTMFSCCKDDARGMAYKLGIRFTTLNVADDYLKMVEKPKHGYGRGMNPCVDCRGYMFALAKKFMEEVGASFLISGEVLGQRPMSQKRRDFDRIEEDAELSGLILRPLSAKRLPLTEPEKQGVVDRSKFYGIQGRSRQKLLELAKKYGIEAPPAPSAGCSLTSPEFGKKVKDVFTHHPDYERLDFELLKIGRHFRLDSGAKVVLAKNQQQNELLESSRKPGTFLLRCENFGGPTALVRGEKSLERMHQVAALMLRYAGKPLPETCFINVLAGEASETFVAPYPAEESFVEALRIV